MKRLLLALGVIAVLLAVGFGLSSSSQAEVGIAENGNFAPSKLFDSLDGEPDVVYLLANSSVIFGPDPNGRSEEITFVGPVTVPKWPMPGFERRTLADGRQQIDIELVESDLIGQSYLLGGPVVLGEHPDLRSTGTITERPRSAPIRLALASTTSTSTSTSPSTDTTTEEPSEEVPADFVVVRKVMLTTAKGVLYNETAVPVKGRINSIPPVVFNDTPTGVNVFRGMELPVALLDESGSPNGWFYSKAHMAYAVKPKAVERAIIHGSVALRVDGKVETVELSGPAEIHHGSTTTDNGHPQTDVEVMVLALRGHSELLGGDIMVAEAFSDRDRFSSGKLSWDGTSVHSELGLYVEMYTPSSKLGNRKAIPISGDLKGLGKTGEIGKGKLQLPLVNTEGRLSSHGEVGLYDEAEQLTADIVGLDLQLEKRSS